MTQTKQNLDKLLDFIKGLIEDPSYTEDFTVKLQNLLNKHNEKHPLPSYAQERVDAIYEYCIEQKLKKQAEELYKNFPFENLREQLMADYVRMEKFRLKDSFDDFGLALYQQIEAIINALCVDNRFCKAVKGMWYKPFNTVFQNSGNINKRYDANGSVGKHFVGDKIESTTGRKMNDFYYRKGLMSLTANNKIDIIIYFLVYRTDVNNNNKEFYKKDCEKISYAYNARNLVHRGGTPSDKQNEKIETMLNNRAYFYIYLLGILATFIGQVINGLKNSLPIIESSIKESNQDNKDNQTKITETGTIYSKNPGSIFINVREENKLVPEELRKKIESCNKNDQIKVTFEGDTIVDVEPIA